jgi:hypothetical protein
VGGTTVLASLPLLTADRVFSVATSLAFTGASTLEFQVLGALGLLLLGAVLARRALRKEARQIS